MDLLGKMKILWRWAAARQPISKNKVAIPKLGILFRQGSPEASQVLPYCRSSLLFDNQVNDILVC